MVDADEETALLSAARAGSVESPRRRGRVIAFVLVLVGALALVAAAGRGAADLAVGITGSGTLGTYGAVEVDGEDGAPFQVTGFPTHAPPQPRLYHKGPPSSPDDSHDPHHDDDEDDDKPCDEEVGNGVGGGSGHSLSSKCVAMHARGDLRDHARSAKSAGPMKYQPIQSVTSFFAKILSRPTRTLAKLIIVKDDNDLDIYISKVDSESMEQYYTG